MIFAAVTLTLASMYNVNAVIFNNLFENIASSSNTTTYSMSDYGISSDSTIAYSASEAIADTSVNYQSPSTTAIEQAAVKFNYLSIFIMLVIIISSGFITYFAVRYALRPMRNLGEKISKLSEHDLNYRIQDFQAGDEINHLADSFNALIGRLEQAFNSQKRFSTAAAHELKTPLAIIKTNIDVLNIDSEYSEEEYRNVITVTKSQTDRMIKLVENLFAVSMSAEYDIVDDVIIEEMIRDIVIELNPLIANRGIDVSIICSGNHMIKANHPMLRQSFANIIENAIKYNKTGGKVNIAISDSYRRIHINIADNGIGLSEEHIPHIFEPFYRVDTSRSRKAGGTGLGLAITEETIRRHDGKIYVESNKGEGTVFFIELPKLS